MARNVLVIAALTMAVAASLALVASPDRPARAAFPPIRCPNGVSSTKATGILQYDAGLIVFIRFPDDLGYEHGRFGEQ